MYEAIVRESRKDQELDLKDSAKLGLYRNDISMRQYYYLRMTTNSEVKKHPPKDHTGPVNSSMGKCFRTTSSRLLVKIMI